MLDCWARAQNSPTIRALVNDGWRASTGADQAQKREKRFVSGGLRCLAKVEMVPETGTAETGQAIAFLHAILSDNSFGPTFGPTRLMVRRSIWMWVPSRHPDCSAPQMPGWAALRRAASADLAPEAATDVGNGDVIGEAVGRHVGHVVAGRRAGQHDPAHAIGAHVAERHRRMIGWGWHLRIVPRLRVADQASSNRRPSSRFALAFIAGLREMSDGGMPIH